MRRHKGPAPDLGLCGPAWKTATKTALEEEDEEPRSHSFSSRQAWKCLVPAGGDGEPEITSHLPAPCASAACWDPSASSRTKPLPSGNLYSSSKVSCPSSCLFPVSFRTLLSWLRAQSRELCPHHECALPARPRCAGGAAPRQALILAKCTMGRRGKGWKILGKEST